MIGYTTEAQKLAEIARLKRQRAEIDAALAAAYAAPVELDLSEADCAYCDGHNALLGAPDVTEAMARRAGLLAAYPALHRALGAPAVPVWPSDDELEAIKDDSNHGNSYTAMDRLARRLREWQQANAAPEPTEAEDLAMADELVSEWNKNMGMLRNLAFAAIRAERRRAQGGAK